MNIELNWKGKMAFEGTGPSGFVQQVDADLTAGGENSAPRPMELIAMGLAGCTAMDVISILAKKQQKIKDFQVRVHAERATEHPKVFTSSIIEYHITGTQIDEAAVLRAIQLSAEKYCPAQAMLSKAFPIRLTYKIIDEQTGEIIKQGEFKMKEASA